MLKVLTCQNFVDSIGSGDVFFAYYIVLNYLKDFTTEEKLLLEESFVCCYT